MCYTTEGLCMATHQLKEISPKHSRMAFYLARGAEQEGVARRFGIHPATMSRLMSDDLFKREVTRIQKQIEERSLILVEDAQKPIYDALKKFSNEIVRLASDSTSENVRLNAMKLGYQVIQPSMQKDMDMSKQVQELRMKIETVNKNVSDEPELKLVVGGKS